MSAMAFIQLVVSISLGLVVFSLGLTARPSDATHLLRDRGLLARSMLSMNVFMPVIALWIALVVPLAAPVKLAIVTLSISPVPPFLPSRIGKSGGDPAYNVSLLIAASIASLVVIPVTLAIFELFVSTPLHPPLGRLLRLVGNGILVPLALGMLARWVAPRLAEKAARPLSLVAMLALATALVPILVRAWRPMLTLVGDGAVLAFAVMAIVGMGVGHALGGPRRADRTVLALATTMRHPAVAISIATAAFPDSTLAVAAILLDLIVAFIATAPYAKRSRQAVRLSAATSRRVHPGRRSTDRVPSPLSASPPRDQ
jgi:BASS family bile acid:Na+ symporter